jgi:hypothetical protein
VPDGIVGHILANSSLVCTRGEHWTDGDLTVEVRTAKFQRRESSGRSRGGRGHYAGLDSFLADLLRRDRMAGVVLLDAPADFDPRPTIFVEILYPLRPNDRFSRQVVDEVEREFVEVEKRVTAEHATDCILDFVPTGGLTLADLRPRLLARWADTGHRIGILIHPPA